MQPVNDSWDGVVLSPCPTIVLRCYYQILASRSRCEVVIRQLEQSERLYSVIFVLVLLMAPLGIFPPFFTVLCNFPNPLTKFVSTRSKHYREFHIRGIGTIPQPWYTCCENPPPRGVANAYISITGKRNSLRVHARLQKADKAFFLPGLMLRLPCDPKPVQRGLL